MGNRDTAPDVTKTLRPGGLAGRTLAAVAGGLTYAPALRASLEGRGSATFRQRLSELVDLGWIEHHVLLTDAGRQAVERMNSKKGTA